MTREPPPHRLRMAVGSQLEREAGLESPPAVQGDAAGPSRRMFYERLAQVSVRHAYYNATGGACPDLVARPTAWTAALMKRLGLLFRQEETGFSVLFNRLRADSLLGYLEDTTEHAARGGPWTRLCFVLAPRNPAFVSFTEIPVDTSPARRNVYLTNRQAHVAADDTVLLTPRDRVTAADLVPVSGSQFVEETPEGVRYVRVLAVSGEEVVCKPRCVTADAAARTTPDRFTCADLAPRDRGICAERLFFDLGAYPEERYEIETVWNDGPPTSTSYLYTASYPIPLCFVELLLTDPTRGGAGVYPVRGLDVHQPEIRTVSYVVPFGARSTWWNYYVTARAPDGERGELRIRQVRARGEERVAFRGPCCVTLPGGRAAWRFVSARPIALRQRPTLHLQLLWRGEGERHPRVLMDRLPLATGEQVLPLEGDRACLQAQASLCGPHPGPRCRRLLRALCPQGPRSGPERRTFSDIYVTV